VQIITIQQKLYTTGYSLYPISSPPIFAEKELNILGPGVLRKMPHIQFGVTAITIIPTVTVSIAIVTVVVAIIAVIITVIIATIPIIVPSHLGL
jgi:hypothetical protein